MTKDYIRMSGSVSAKRAGCSKEKAAGLSEKLKQEKLRAIHAAFDSRKIESWKGYKGVVVGLDYGTNSQFMLGLQDMSGRPTISSEKYGRRPNSRGVVPPITFTMGDILFAAECYKRCPVILGQDAAFLSRATKLTERSRYEKAIPKLKNTKIFVVNTRVNGNATKEAKNENSDRSALQDKQARKWLDIQDAQVLERLMHERPDVFYPIKGRLERNRDLQNNTRAIKDIAESNADRKISSKKFLQSLNLNSGFSSQFDMYILTAAAAISGLRSVNFFVDRFLGLHHAGRRNFFRGGVAIHEASQAAGVKRGRLEEWKASVHQRLRDSRRRAKNIAKAFIQASSEVKEQIREGLGIPQTYEVTVSKSQNLQA